MNPILREAILQNTHQLIRVAEMNNAVVTITLQPKLPLAMGNYEMVADVRPVRGKPPVAVCGNCDSALPEGCGGHFADEPQCEGHHRFDLDAMCNAMLALLTREIDSHVKYHKQMMASSYSEVKRAMEKRHDHYHKEMMQMAWANMANLGMYEAAQALHLFAQSYSNLRKSSVTFFPPLN